VKISGDNLAALTRQLQTIYPSETSKIARQQRAGPGSQSGASKNASTSSARLRLAGLIAGRSSMSLFAQRRRDWRECGTGRLGADRSSAGEPSPNALVLSSRRSSTATHSRW
jgi:hypothetical protein